MFKFVRKLYQLAYERHHLIADDVIPKGGLFPSRRGVATCIPTVVMHSSDHYQTPSWGKSKAAANYRASQKLLVDARKFREATLKEIDKLKTIQSATVKGKTLYDVYKVGIDQALAALDLMGADNLDKLE